MLKNCSVTWFSSINGENLAKSVATMSDLDRSMRLDRDGRKMTFSGLPFGIQLAERGLYKLEDKCRCCFCGITQEISEHSDCRCRLPRHPNMVTLEARMNSFKYWPKQMTPTKDKLATSGFFYLGLGDIVKCFQCGVSLCDWEKECDPDEKHMEMSDCTFNRIVTEKESEVSGKECEICIKGGVSYVFVPCGHGTCKNCCLRLTDCPFCKSAIDYKLKIFI